MIPKHIIEIAIRGGWENVVGKELQEAGIHGYSGIWQQVALDPIFWQALGKELGWEEKNILYRRDTVGGFIAHENGKAHDELLINYASEPRWHYNALLFFDLILTGKDIEQFWTEIITKHI